MSWLRLDDDFATNPKILALTVAERWTWLRVLLWAAKHADENGRVFDSVDELIRPLKRLRPKLRTLRLLDPEDVIHDWHEYNGSNRGARERMRRLRAARSTVSPNSWQKARTAVYARDRGICADCGKDCSGVARDGRDLWNADHEPPRQQLDVMGVSIYDIDYIVTRCHSCHAKKTRAQDKRTQFAHQANTEANTEANDVRSTRTAARARPVPWSSPREVNQGTDPPFDANAPALEATAAPASAGPYGPPPPPPTTSQHGDMPRPWQETYSHQVITYAHAVGPHDPDLPTSLRQRWPGIPDDVVSEALAAVATDTPASP